MTTYNPSTDLCRRQRLSRHLDVLIACDLSSVRDAAKYLADRGVPFEVAHRVLLHPEQRRRLS